MDVKSKNSIDSSDLVHTRDIPSRRSFIKRVLGGAGVVVVAGAPYIGCSEGKNSFEAVKDAAAGLASGSVGDEQFWRKVKDQFIIDKKLIMMNAANLAPSPAPVTETLFNYTRDVNEDASSGNRSKFGEIRQNTREAIAGFIGAGAEETAIVRNTSEANNMVINGLRLQKGDEVVIWDQNHITLNGAWDVRAEWYGFTVKRVETPPDPESAEDLVKPFRDALTNRTRVLGFSDTSNISGVYLPAKELCAMAREAGILSIVDGVQTVGARNINVHDIGCDFYTFSSHKWLVGPREAGILYVRKERVAGLHPSVVGIGWSSALESGSARKFETLGQQDDAKIAAFGTAVEFHNALGKDRIEERVLNLASALKHEIQKKIPAAEFYTPLKTDLCCGVAKFALPNEDLGDAGSILYEQHNLVCAIMGGSFPGIRLSPHLYNTMEDIEKAVDAVVQLV